MKKNNRISRLFFIAMFALALAGCPDNVEPDQDLAAIHAALSPQITYRVATVSYPLQYLTQRIVGDGIKVEFTTGHRPSDQNWQPSEEDVAILQQADLVIVNGPGAVYADWLSRVSISDAKLCNSCMDLATKDFILINDYKIVHKHGPEGEHSHPYMVAYTWLDPAIAKKQSRKILKDLSTIYSDRATDFGNNFDALAKDLDELSSELAKVGRDKETKVVSINPLFKFFTRAANLEDHHLLWLTAERDSKRPKQLQEKLSEVRGDKNNQVALLIPREGEYLLDQALGPDFETTFNVKACYITTFDQSPATGDYLSEMRKNIEAVNSAIIRVEDTK